MLTVYECSQCHQLAYSQTDADAHLKTAHPGDEAHMQAVRFRCPKCGILWNHPSDLRNHLQREHRVWVKSEDLVVVPLNT
jgi:uncharacterized C2H2 Zn-finger protein